MKYISLFLIGLAASGCINRATATLAPGAGFSHVNTFYVVHQPRDKEKLHQMISDNLSMKGYRSTAGPELPPESYKTDAIITYVDKWMWDITLYLLELTVTVREPTGQPLAVGNSYHTSMTRLSPQEMIDEVLGNILGLRSAPVGATAGPPEITVQPVKDSSRPRPNFANQKCEVKSWPAREECSGSACC